MTSWPCEHLSGLTPSERRAYLAGKRRTARVPWYSEPFTELQEWLDRDDSGMSQYDIRNRRGRKRKVFSTGEKRQSSRTHDDLGQDAEYLSTDGWTPKHVKPEESLPRLPFSVEELREAIHAGRHRAGEQRLIVDVFRAYLTKHKPHDATLALVLDCSPRTIQRYRSEGSKLLEEIAKEVKTAVREAVHEEHERQLTIILAALGFDPIGDAEEILVNDAAQYFCCRVV